MPESEGDDWKLWFDAAKAFIDLLILFSLIKLQVILKIKDKSIVRNIEIKITKKIISEHLPLRKYVNKLMNPYPFTLFPFHHLRIQLWTVYRY